MIGASGGPRTDSSEQLDTAGLPPLVLRCRLVWRLAYGGAAIALLGLGASTLAADPAPGSPGTAALATAVLLFLFGAGCAQFFLRYCLARLTLDDRGFRFSGPLRGLSEVAWMQVRDWRRIRGLSGHGALHIVHGDGRLRLSIPLIYEDAHLLEIGLGQRRFPIW